jgi:hypothetical protein
VAARSALALIIAAMPLISALMSSSSCFGFVSDVPGALGVVFAARVAGLALI